MVECAPSFRRRHKYGKFVVLSTFKVNYQQQMNDNIPLIGFSIFDSSTLVKPFSISEKRKATN